MDHFYERIPGFFDFQDVYADVVRRAYNGARFVEVGAWKGKSAAFMATEIINSGKMIEFDVVDVWESLAWTSMSSGQLATLEEFAANVAPAKAGIAACHMMRSTEAAALYEDGSLDFVFIDAQHTYEAVRDDIAAWRPKVRGGGVLAGHDHVKAWPGVERAVREAFGASYKVSRSSWIVEVER